jgi:tetratricopeptide (TPR) repeat protein/DNA-binding NarL/FixJ family response regulator
MTAVKLPSLMLPVLNLQKLQRIAIIVAFLAIFTGFQACKQPNPHETTPVSEASQALFSKLAVAANYSTPWLDSVAQKLQEIRPKNAPLVELSTAHRNLGWRYCDLKDFGPAMLQFQRALELAALCNDPLQLTEAYLAIGWVFHRFQSPQNALNYFTKALEASRKTKNDNLTARAYHELSKNRIYAGQYNEAFELAQYGLQLKNITEQCWKVQLQNDIGLTYLRQKQYKEAKIAFTAALELAGDDLYAKGYVYGNIGSMYIAKGDLSKAIGYLQKDRNISMQFADYPSAASANIDLASIMLQLGKLSEAKIYLEQADSLFLLDPEKNFDISNYKIWLELVSKLSSEKDQIHQFKTLTHQLNQVLVNETATNNRQIASITKIIETNNQKKAEELLALKKAKNQAAYLNLILLFLIALMVTSFFLVFRNKMLAQKHRFSNLKLEAQEKELKIIQQQHELQASELKYQQEVAQNQIYQLEQMQRSYTQTQLSKSLAEEVIFHLSDAVQNVLKTERSLDQTTKQKLENSLRVLSQTKESTTEVDLPSYDEQVDFVFKLNQRFPDLSSDEIKLCTYLRMNMSTKEIARIKMITVAGVNKSRNRLRKKFELTPEIDLHKFLLDI